MTPRLVCFLIAIACHAGDSPVSGLPGIRRVHVERLNGESAAQIRDMIINALQASKVFVVTENPEKADAILRGTAEDLIYTENFQAGERVNARAGIGSSGSVSRSSGVRLPGASVGVGVDESVKTEEREARGDRGGTSGRPRRRRDLVYDTGEQRGEVSRRERRCSGKSRAPAAVRSGQSTGSGTPSRSDCPLNTP
jgi:hypothetical protein